MPVDSPPGPEGPADDVQCPGCGRFVGPMARCPHCGASMPRRLSLRLFRWASVLLATVGLALLYAMVRARDVPPVRIGEISQTMNFAYVRVEGNTVGEPRVFRSGARIDGLRFTIDDGSGSLQVRMRGPLAEEVEREGRVPGAGDYVEVAGSLQVTAEGSALWVQDASALRVERKAIPSVPLAGIAVEHSEPVRVQARVVSVRAPPQGSRAPWEITIEDGSGRGALVAFGSVMDDMAPDTRPAPGMWIDARVLPSVYRGRLQLRLGSASDLRRIEPLEVSPESEAPTAPRRRLSELADVPEGAFVEIEAEVVQVRRPPEGSRAPWHVILQDGSGVAVPMVFWSHVADGLGDRMPRPGLHVRARTRREAYRGDIQLRLVEAGDLHVTGAGASP